MKFHRFLKNRRHHGMIHMFEITRQNGLNISDSFHLRKAEILDTFHIICSTPFEFLFQRFLGIFHQKLLESSLRSRRVILICQMKNSLDSVICKQGIDNFGCRPVKKIPSIASSPWKLKTKKILKIFRFDVFEWDFRNLWFLEFLKKKRPAARRVWGEEQFRNVEFLIAGYEYNIRELFHWFIEISQFFLLDSVHFQNIHMCFNSFPSIAKSFFNSSQLIELIPKPKLTEGLKM